MAKNLSKFQPGATRGASLETPSYSEVLFRLSSVDLVSGPRTSAYGSGGMTWVVPEFTSEAIFYLWGDGGEGSGACCCAGNAGATTGASAKFCVATTPGDVWCMSGKPGGCCLASVSGIQSCRTQLFNLTQGLQYADLTGGWCQCTACWAPARLSGDAVIYPTPGQGLMCGTASTYGGYDLTKCPVTDGYSPYQCNANTNVGWDSDQNVWPMRAPFIATPPLTATAFPAQTCSISMFHAVQKFDTRCNHYRNVDHLCNRSNVGVETRYGWHCAMNSNTNYYGSCSFGLGGSSAWREGGGCTCGGAGSVSAISIHYR